MNSSVKINRPPGGASSNIFGVDPPGSLAVPVRSNQNYMRSTLFDESLPAAGTGDRKRSKEDTHAKLFGGTETEQPTQSKELNGNKNETDGVKQCLDQNRSDSRGAHELEQDNRRKTINPITGTTNDDASILFREDPSDDQSKIRRSRTCKQPPGGFSSKLW